MNFVMRRPGWSDALFYLFIPSILNASIDTVSNQPSNVLKVLSKNASFIHGKRYGNNANIPGISINGREDILCIDINICSPKFQAFEQKGERDREREREYVFVTDKRIKST